MGPRVNKHILLALMPCSLSDEAQLALARLLLADPRMRTQAQAVIACHPQSS